MRTLQLSSPLRSIRSQVTGSLITLLALVIGATLTACSEEPATPSPSPWAPLAVASGPLEAGFGKADLRWRAGAKPGQVGTSALPERDFLFVMGAAHLLGNAFQDDPAELLSTSTEWAHNLLTEQVDTTEAGAYSKFFEAGQGIELPPDVRAVVLRRGDIKVALVRADLYIMSEHFHRRVAELVAEETGIDRDQLFLVGTHNHSVAHAISPGPGIWTRADGFDPRHFVYVTHQIAQAIRDADANRQPAILRTSRHTFDEVQHNIIGPSEISMRPPEGGDPQTIQVGYPYDYFDSDLVTLRLDTPGGDPLGFIFTLGMHPESLPEGHGLVSGEWPIHVEQQILAEQGVEAMWLPGALGDVEADRGRVNPEHEFFRAGFGPMKEMVDIITRAVTEAWQATGDEPGNTEPLLAQIARDVPGPDRHPLPDLAELAGFRVPMVRVVQDSTAMRLHMVRIGDVLLSGLPAEITADMSLNIRSRLDQEPGNVYQGYVWPSAPDWVRDRIHLNFGTSELDPTEGAPIPVVISMTNAYFGYMVSRWEYENRNHYRQSMTPFGPGTADHVASALVEMGRELAGTAPVSFSFPQWRGIDLDGVHQIQAYLRGLDERVQEMARQFPPSDPEEVGQVLLHPAPITDSSHPIRFRWVGGTNDMEPPLIYVEEEVEGHWTPKMTAPNGEVYLLFEAPDVWTALWNHPPVSDAPLRFRIEGTYRGTQSGVSDIDPLWDPAGANVPYAVASDSFVVTEPPAE